MTHPNAAIPAHYLAAHAKASSEREILRLVWDAERSSGEIASHFEASWPSISRSLKTLRDAGAVKERRLGNRRLYRADCETLRPLDSFLRGFWAGGLERIGELMEDGRREPRV